MGLRTETHIHIYSVSSVNIASVCSQTTIQQQQVVLVAQYVRIDFGRKWPHKTNRCRKQ